MHAEQDIFLNYSFHFSHTFISICKKIIFAVSPLCLIFFQHLTLPDSNSKQIPHSGSELSSTVISKGARAASERCCSTVTSSPW